MYRQRLPTGKLRLLRSVFALVRWSPAFVEPMTNDWSTGGIFEIGDVDDWCRYKIGVVTSTTPTHQHQHDYQSDDDKPDGCSALVGRHRRVRSKYSTIPTMIHGIANTR